MDINALLMDTKDNIVVCVKDTRANSLKKLTKKFLSLYQQRAALNSGAIVAQKAVPASATTCLFCRAAHVAAKPLAS